MINISSKQIKFFIVLYITIPLYLFFFGWTKPIIAVCLSILLFLASSSYLRNTKNIETLQISKKTLIVSIILILFFTIFTGVGGYFSQTDDSHWRNAIFTDLINYSWPVYYPKIDSIMCYYFLFWLPAAIVGKIFGHLAANFALYLYMALGIYLVFLLMLKKDNCSLENVIIIIFIIFSFGIIEFIASLIYHSFIQSHIINYRWAFVIDGLQIINNHSNLSYIYNQTTVPWLATLLIIQDKNVSSFAYLGCISIVYAPFSIVGILTYTVFFGFKKLIEMLKKKKLSYYFKEIFSIPNILSVICLVPLFFLFYSSNTKTSSGGTGQLLEWTYKNSSMQTFFTVLFFYLVAIIPLYIVLFPKFKNEFLFHVTFFLILVFPHLKLSTTNLNDFSSHGLPIPMICLTYYVIQAILDNDFYLKRRLLHSVLVILISLGSLNYVGEIWYQLKDISQSHEIGIKDNLNTLEDKTDAVNFVSHHPDESLFSKYIIKDYYH